MSKFRIKVARMEAVSGGRPDSHVRITFEIKNGPALFQVPIDLKDSDYDDTEMLQAARSALHRMFVELSHQTLQWKLSATDLRLLSEMSSRPGK